MDRRTRGIGLAAAVVLACVISGGLYAQDKPAEPQEPVLAGDSEAVKAYNDSEADYSKQVHDNIANCNETLAKALAATYEDTAAIESAWEAWSEQTKYPLPSELWDHPIDTQALGADAEKAEANLKERAKVREGLANAHYAEEGKKTLAFAIKLSQRAVEIGDAMNAQWLLRQVLTTNSMEELPEFNKAIETAVKAYEEWMFKTFKAAGLYADYGTGKGCGCVFSDKPFPEKVDGTIEPICKMLFKGTTQVNVLCRLPQPAKAYTGYLNGRIYLQLVSNSDGFEANADSKLIGTPEGIGDTAYLRTTFKLPPATFEKNRRWWFRVQAVIVYNKPLESGDFQDDLTEDGTFFWLK